MRTCGLVCLVVLLSATATAAKRTRNGNSVSYDGRSLIINGKRDLLISGSIHYPRSTPGMWPDLIKRAKDGGLNVIQTYVFWNGHEPVKGQYNFEGRYDLVGFVKEIQKQNMYCTLRVGPFIQAEWHHGGFPYWLRDEPGMIFRTDNNPFKYYMRKFVKMIIDKMADEKLFVPQGGPIILSQIENEYDMVQRAFRLGGTRYIQWAGDLALNSKAGIPWMMCKQKDVPGPIISSCNGRNCGDTNKADDPTKPILWAEDWTAQFRSFGDPPSQRSTEDLAYGAARFFSKNGTLINYYMYHGGTNFGRTGASFIMTRYYDEAPLDEYGLPKEPKWGHLRDLHYALRLSQKALLWGSYSLEPLGPGLEARIYQIPGSNVCSAFLSNSNTRTDSFVNFRGQDYYLPRHSISILPDCKNVVYNTHVVNSQHNLRTYIAVKEPVNNVWEMYQETVPTFSDTEIVSQEPMELFNLTKDETDYLWYTTTFPLEDDDFPRRGDIRPVVQVSNLGHAMIAFANGQYIGDGHGSKIEKSFLFSRPMNLRPGENQLAFLGMAVGHPDGGAYLEHRQAGVHTVAVQGLNTGTFDLTSNNWGHEAGIRGEKLQIYNEAGLSKVQWKPSMKSMPITWYKRYFDAPHGDDPIAVDMSSMGKGMIWINGENIGRYWVSFLNPLGKPSQSLYHIPRSFLKPTGNLMVVFEEQGGDPEGITIHWVKRDNICTVFSPLNTGSVMLWKRQDGEIGQTDDAKPEGYLQCGDKKIIKTISFADFGNPTGMCGELIPGNCSNPLTQKVVEKACLGQNSCRLDLNPEVYGADAKCPWTTSTLAVQAKCSRPKKGGDDDN